MKKLGSKALQATISIADNGFVEKNDHKSKFIKTMVLSRDFSSVTNFMAFSPQANYTD
jgi:hypothetical protein